MSLKIPINKSKIKNLVMVLAIFGVGYLAGYQRFSFGLAKQDNGQSQIVINRELGKPEAVDFSLFWDAWQKVEDKYVRGIDNQDRLYGAIGGMVDGLGDPFSGFMKPSENVRFNEEINGNFDGIGAELTLKNGLVTVVTPLEDSPAQKAGLLPEDIIVKIDNQDSPKVLDEAVRLIRGNKGTQVRLSIIRDGREKEVAITRDKVEVKSVTYTNKDGIGIIKINQFTGNTTDLLDKAITESKNSGNRGIVLDLRNNPGGLLNVSVEVASRFMSGVVLVERDKAKNETEEKTVSGVERVTLPMIALVNKGSASASEIVAGALRDSGRARLVGQTTFGKGSVQTIETLKDGSAVRITIAEWLTPKRQEINKIGIVPDISVSISEDDIANKRDPQMDKALELLK